MFVMAPDICEIFTSSGLACFTTMTQKPLLELIHKNRHWSGIHCDFSGSFPETGPTSAVRARELASRQSLSMRSSGSSSFFGDRRSFGTSTECEVAGDASDTIF